VPTLQSSLFGMGEPAIDPDGRFDRTDLDGDSWIDVSRPWLLGADALFTALVDTVPWKQGRRKMYDRVLDDPRLSRWYRPGDDLPHPALHAMRVALGSHYRVAFASVGLNYYRDGRDSVAPHADRELKELDDTLVAIVTLGAQRPFLVRHQAGGASVDVRPASGDLLVMGGQCQRTHHHGVPKVRHCGPRISVSFRWTRPTDDSPDDPPAATLDD
jgi:alkylated DNA repair dioxygenase AlkB